MLAGLNKKKVLMDEQETACALTIDHENRSKLKIVGACAGGGAGSCLHKND